MPEATPTPAQRLRSWWRQRSRLAAFAAYLAAIELILLLVTGIQRLLNSQATRPGGWIYFVGLCLLVCLLLLGFRWFRRVVMWRLRHRLIVAYGFIGVIPVVLLVAMGLIAAYLFAGQFATFVISSDIATELKTLESANREIAISLAGEASHGNFDKALDAFSSRADRSLTVWIESPDGKRRAYTLPVASSPAPPPQSALEKDQGAVTSDESGLHLRAWTTLSAGRDRLTLISTLPLDKYRLERIAANLGEITVRAPNFHAPTVKVDKKKPQGLAITSDDEKVNQGIVIRGGKQGQVLVQAPEGKGVMLPTLPPLTAGAPPSPTGRFDREVIYGTPLKVVDWDTGKNTSAFMQVRTRPSRLYGRLFVTLGEFADLILVVLGAIAIFFAVIELLALITGISITRTITRSVADLYNATQHINRGDLTYRIKVKTHDQLGALEDSFNSMSSSLEKLIAEQKEKQRMESELAIAQEVQAQLFPQEAQQLQTLEVHGVCRPARTVSGDYYDFLQLGPERLGIAVGDISGKGISAALLMATIHSAVRVYEFGRMPSQQQLMAAGAAAHQLAGVATAAAVDGLQSPASVLTLLNRHIFHSTPPEKYATLFLGLWDGAARSLTYSNGGHLAPLIMHGDGSLDKLETGGTVVGLLDDMKWEEARIALRPGDLFIAFSDGITEPENEFGEFGEQRLLEVILENRNQSLAAIADAAITAVNDWIGGNEQPDDITLVLARAR